LDAHTCAHTVTLEDELDRTEGSKAYPHQFKKAQISIRTIRSKGGARLETLRRARWQRHAGGGQSHEASARDCQLLGETGCPARAAFHFCEM
jgi:hypothetical protein